MPKSSAFPRLSTLEASELWLHLGLCSPQHSEDKSKLHVYNVRQMEASSWQPKINKGGTDIIREWEGSDVYRLPGLPVLTGQSWVVTVLFDGTAFGSRLSISLIHCGTPGPWAIWDCILWSITTVMHVSHLDVLLGYDAGGAWLGAFCICERLQCCCCGWWSSFEAHLINRAVEELGPAWLQNHPHLSYHPADDIILTDTNTSDPCLLGVWNPQILDFSF